MLIVALEGKIKVAPLFICYCLTITKDVDLKLQCFDRLKLPGFVVREVAKTVIIASIFRS
jgi:hypothetical protein